MCFVLHTFLSALQFGANPPTPSQMELQQQSFSDIIMNNLLHPVSKSRAEIPTIFGVNGITSQFSLQVHVAAAGFLVACSGVNGISLSLMSLQCDWYVDHRLSVLRGWCSLLFSQIYHNLCLLRVQAKVSLEAQRHMCSTCTCILDVYFPLAHVYSDCTCRDKACKYVQNCAARRCKQTSERVIVSSSLFLDSYARASLAASALPSQVVHLIMTFV